MRSRIEDTTHAAGLALAMMAPKTKAESHRRAVDRQLRNMACVACEGRAPL